VWAISDHYTRLRAEPFLVLFTFTCKLLAEEKKLSTVDWVMIVAGMTLLYTFPIALIAFCIALAGAARQRVLPPAVRHQGWIVLGLYFVVIAAYCAGAGTIVPALDWAAEGLLIGTAVLVGLFLRRSLTRPLHAITWVLMVQTLFLAAFMPYTVWIAGEASRVSAYDNPDEAKARAAITKNPNDAATHSSLAHIDMTRRDRAGAMAEWRQVLRVEPDNVDALLVLGGELSQDGRIDEARPLFQRLAARKDDLSVNARKWLARHKGQ